MKDGEKRIRAIMGDITHALDKVAKWRSDILDADNIDYAPLLSPLGDLEYDLSSIQGTLNDFNA